MGCGIKVREGGELPIPMEKSGISEGFEKGEDVLRSMAAEVFFFALEDENRMLGFEDPAGAAEDFEFMALGIAFDQAD